MLSSADPHSVGSGEPASDPRSAAPAAAGATAVAPQSPRAQGEYSRALIERAVLLLACGVVCPLTLLSKGYLAEAVALPLLCVLALMARPPASWASRTCLDSGMLYGTALVSMALASNMMHQQRGDAAFERHASIIFGGGGVWPPPPPPRGGGGGGLPRCGRSSADAWPPAQVGCAVSASTENSFTTSASTAPLRALLCASFVTRLALDPTRGGQRAYIYTTLVLFELGSQLVRRALVRSFTVGEALVVVQAVTIATTDFVALTASRVVPGSTPYYAEHRSPVQVALQGGLLGVIWLAVALAPFFRAYARSDNETIDVDPREPGPRARADSALLQWDSLSAPAAAGFYAVTAAWLTFIAGWVALLLPQRENPVVFVARFTFGEARHLGVAAFWFLALGAGLPLIHWLAKRGNLTLIIVRKLYHLQALVMFVPAVALAPEFLSLSFGVATALLLFLEYVRACRVPPLGVWLHAFMRSYTDQRDEGVAILTHLYLLLGCALPVWICPADDTGLAPYAGIIILGAGDAAGAIVGSTRGRRRWTGGRKTLVGTASAIAATAACSLFVMVACLPPPAAWRPALARMLLASVATCLLEAFTTQIDNLVLPLFFVSVLRI
jgi:dolichol kinase